jgi:hypothetical protein
MASENPTVWPLRDALRTARAVLDGEMGIIEGSVALARYAHDVVPKWSVDPDFVVFGALASVIVVPRHRVAGRRPFSSARHGDFGLGCIAQDGCSSRSRMHAAEY